MERSTADRTSTMADPWFAEWVKYAANDIAETG